MQIYFWIRESLTVSGKRIHLGFQLNCWLLKAGQKGNLLLKFQVHAKIIQSFYGSVLQNAVSIYPSSKKNVRKYSYLPIIKQNSGTFTSVTCTKDTHGILIFSKQIFINFFKDKQRIPVNSSISGNVGSNILSVLGWEEGKQSIIMFMRERTTIKTPNDSPWVWCEHV